MNKFMRVTRKDFFDYVVLNDLEKALNHFFSLDSALEFEDGMIFNTKEKLRDYCNEKERECWDGINNLNPEVFQ